MRLETGEVISIVYLLAYWAKEVKKKDEKEKPAEAGDGDGADGEPQAPSKEESRPEQLRRLMTEQTWTNAPILLEALEASLKDEGSRDAVSRSLVALLGTHDSTVVGWVKRFIPGCEHFDWAYLCGKIVRHELPTPHAVHAAACFGSSTPKSLQEALQTFSRGPRSDDMQKALGESLARFPG